jgi:predicted nucleotidyltransferase
MKTIGIIAEYNPFHSGHAYQIRQVRERFGADYVVVVMSGDFVQRGEPAIFDKYLRTEVALSCGADLVLELPVCFATSSAEDFAMAGVTLLDRLGIVNGICFGSELGDIAPLKAAAQILSEEPKAYQETLQSALRAGESFPKARSQALASVMRIQHTAANPIVPDILSSPNNILGIEYLKALQRRNSRIEPLTICRQGQGYHDTKPTQLNLTADPCTKTAEHSPSVYHPSASALRTGIQDGSIDYFRYLQILYPNISKGSAGSADISSPILPGSDRYSRIPVFEDDLSGILNWKLLELLDAGQDLTVYSDISPELAGRLKNKALQFETFTGRIGQLKTKQYTYTRISRALLHLLLGITNEDITFAKAQDYCSYVRILGFCRSSGALLSAIKQNCTLPIITKTADADQLLDTDSRKHFRRDLLASHLRQTLEYQKSGVLRANEYTRSVIVR